MDFTSTRTFSNHNIVVTTHEGYITNSVAVNTIHMTSSKKSRISAVDQEAGHNALGFLRGLQKIGADNRNVINHGTWEILE
jgi:hypothetical protein